MLILSNKKATMIAVLSIFSLLLAVSCSSQKEQVVDKKITVVGTAQNSKAGAIVISADSGVYYVEGMSGWSEEVLNTSVKITGVLVTVETKAEELVNENGEYSQGSVGKKNIVKQAIVQKK